MEPAAPEAPSPPAPPQADAALAVLLGLQRPVTPAMLNLLVEASEGSVPVSPDALGTVLDVLAEIHQQPEVASPEGAASPASGASGGPSEALGTVLAVMQGLLDAAKQRPDTPVALPALCGSEYEALQTVVETLEEMRGPRPETPALLPMLAELHAERLATAEQAAEPGHAPSPAPPAAASPGKSHALRRLREARHHAYVTALAAGDAGAVLSCLDRGCDAQATLAEQLARCSGAAVAQSAALRRPLHIAAAPPHAVGGGCDSAAVARLLVRRGAELSSRDAAGRTALHLAVGPGGERSFVAALLELGADPTARDSLGHTPVHGAIAASSLGPLDELLCVLPATPALVRPLSCFLDTEDPGSALGSDIHSEALLYAARLDRPEAVRLAVHILCKQGRALNPMWLEPTAWEGSTPLHVAAARGHAATVAELLRHTGGGHSPKKDRAGRAPLHVAARCSNERGAVACVDLLREHGHCVDAPSGSGGRALHDAAAARRIDTCRALMERGAEFQASDGRGVAAESAVLQAVRRKHLPREAPGGARARWPELYSPHCWASARQLSGSDTPRRKVVLPVAGYYDEGHSAAKSLHRHLLPRGDRPVSPA
eukprot:TRINITY_DN13895_c0_g1_i2.p1 TRINITY_DN13895_c0_g1~~TRINITY_DN13895_c0_g1_i2.p1  ORF type:complete len:632 (+),score=183.26 TRINITY_DN13895_c0_g1_i2:91-1896(+)